MRIEVTQQDIDTAVKQLLDLGGAKLAYICPIAQALMRTAPLPTGQEWLVGVRAICVRPLSMLATMERFFIPLDIQQWIKKFDVDGAAAVKPITFEALEC